MNEEKSVVSEKFIKTLKNKKPFDVKSSTYIDSSK